MNCAPGRPGAVLDTGTTGPAPRLQSPGRRQLGHQVLSACAELCEHLTAAQTGYPGTNLTVGYQIKTQRE